MISVPAHPVLQAQCALQERELVKEADGRIGIINPIQVFLSLVAASTWCHKPQDSWGLPLFRNRAGSWGGADMLKFQVVWWVGKKRLLTNMPGLGDQTGLWSRQSCTPRLPQRFIPHQLTEFSISFP